MQVALPLPPPRSCPESVLLMKGSFGSPHVLYGMRFGPSQSWGNRGPEWDVAWQGLVPCVQQSLGQMDVHSLVQGSAHGT